MLYVNDLTGNTANNGQQRGMKEFILFIQREEHGVYSRKNTYFGAEGKKNHSVTLAYSSVKWGWSQHQPQMMAVKNK